jgi:hypothetical protein
MRKRLVESKYIYEKNMVLYNRLSKIEQTYDVKMNRSKSTLVTGGDLEKSQSFDGLITDKN